MPSKKASAKYLFDLYGVIAALTTKNNRMRSKFFELLANGEARVMRSVSDELKSIDEELYNEFQEAKRGRVYLDTTSKHSATQQALMEHYGTNLWGNSPRPEHFEAVAICIVEKLDLVTDEKALTSCRRIATACKLGKPSVMSLLDFSIAD